MFSQYQRFHNWTNELARRVARFELVQKNGYDPEPVVVQVAEDEVIHVWHNSLTAERLTLISLYGRLQEIKGISACRPRVMLPPITHIYS
jgi:hypothetical protein